MIPSWRRSLKFHGLGVQLFAFNKYLLSEGISPGCNKGPQTGQLYSRRSLSHMLKAGSVRSGRGQDWFIRGLSPGCVDAVPSPCPHLVIPLCVSVIGLGPP